MQLRNVSKKSETLMLMMKILASPLFSPFSEKKVSHLQNIRNIYGTIHKRRRQIGGGGVKICCNLPTVKIKTCLGKNCQRLLWTVPRTSFNSFQNLIPSMYLISIYLSSSCCKDDQTYIQSHMFNS